MSSSFLCERRASAKRNFRVWESRRDSIYGQRVAPRSGAALEHAPQKTNHHSERISSVRYLIGNGFRTAPRIADGRPFVRRRHFDP
jgi:hypothetical protein